MKGDLLLPSDDTAIWGPRDLHSSLRQNSNTWALKGPLTLHCKLALPCKGGTKYDLKNDNG